jgi:hypothetical protein
VPDLDAATLIVAPAEIRQQPVDGPVAATDDVARTRTGDGGPAAPKKDAR